MRRIPRTEWIEWLDGLHISGKVAVVSDEHAEPRDGGWEFRSADYDPFDDVVEIVLDDERGRLRVLVESPTEILAVGNDCNPDHITILAPDGPLVITKSLDRSVVDRARPGVSASAGPGPRGRGARGEERGARPVSTHGAIDR